MDTLSAFIKSLPKAELHLHIEGTLEPELLFELARRNKVKLRFRDVAAARKAYDFKNLQSFLDIYYEGANVLRTERDFHDLAMAYFKRASDDGIRRVEMFFDPQTHTARGIRIETIINGLGFAMSEAEDRYGISSGLILCFLRHLSPDDAMRTLKRALPFKDHLLGVGLDSGERNNPPSKFKRVFARARAEGLRAVAHAGEEGPAAYVVEALDLLKAERIDHGVRCAEDPALLRRLSDSGVPLTMCPLSNVKLRVFDRLESHNLKLLLDRGIHVTVNSDDPAYFGGYLARNYEEAARALKLSRRDLTRLARNSIEACFLSAAEKARLGEHRKRRATERDGRRQRESPP